jgi:hypothetical protein
MALPGRDMTEGCENLAPLGGEPLRALHPAEHTSLSLPERVREHCPYIGDLILDIVLHAALSTAWVWDTAGMPDLADPERIALTMLREMGYDVREPLPPFVDKDAPWRI